MLLFGAALQAESPSPAHPAYTKRTWGESEGLPSSRVRALMQSRDGYLWIGTEAGLTRFDGLRFSVFTRKSHPQMVNDDCRALAEDSDGAIWIGTMGGVLRWQNGTFQRFSTKDGLHSGYVHVFCPSRRGGMWIGMGDGLNRFQNGILAGVVPRLGGEIRDVTALLEEDSDELWLGGSQGLFRFNAVTGALMAQRAEDHSGNAWPMIGALSRDAEGKVWMIRDSQLYRLESHTWQLMSSGKAAEVNERFIFHDRHGGTWTSAGTGLNRWQEGQFVRNQSLPWLRSQTIFCMLTDREGNIWVGGEHGLHRWSPRVARAFSVDWGLAHRNATAVFEDRSGRLWIGSEGGLSRFLSDAGEQSPEVTWPLKDLASGAPPQPPAFANYTEADGLIKNAVRALAEDDSGALWIGTTRGVCVLRDGQFSPFPLPGELTGNKIHAIARTGDGSMWLGSELGLHCWGNQRLNTLTQSSGLSHNHVRALLAGRDGALWVGTLGGGVNRLRWQSGAGGQNRLPLPEVTIFGVSNGLSSDTAWAFHQEIDGTLWIGTDRGLNRWKEGRVVAFSTRHGLPDDVVNHIVEDDSSNLWIGCERGVYRVSKEALNAVAEGREASAFCVLYDADDALPFGAAGQNSQPAAWRTRDGRLWFATTAAGVVVFDGRQMVRNATPPRVIIERVLADHQTVFDNAEALPGLRAGASASRGALSFPPGRARSLEFHFTATSLTAPHKNRFKYRLEGVDSAWVDSGSRRVAPYHALPPGEYTLRVIACNNDGVWNSEGASFVFAMAPYFYQTWAFRGVVGGGLMTAIALIMWRERKLSRLRQQVALHEERARITRDLHDDLGAVIGRLKAHSPLCGPGCNLSRIANEAAQSLDALIWSTEAKTRTLEDFAGFLSGYAYDYLKGTALRLRLEIPPELPRWPLSTEACHHLPRLVKEALHNILKHAQASAVAIQLEICAGEPGAVEANASNHRRQGEDEPLAWIRLAVIDDGCGFEVPRPDGVTAGASAMWRSGLANMCERVGCLKGSLQIHSAPGQGTAVVLTLPIEAEPVLSSRNGWRRIADRVGACFSVLTRLFGASPIGFRHDT